MRELQNGDLLWDKRIEVHVEDAEIHAIQPPAKQSVVAWTLAVQVSCHQAKRVGFSERLRRLVVLIDKCLGVFFRTKVGFELFDYWIIEAKVGAGELLFEDSRAGEQG